MEPRKELARATEDASNAVGMTVEFVNWAPDRWTIELFGPIDGPDGEQPIEQSHFDQRAEALAYLNGLETGGRIARERYGELREAALHALADVNTDLASMSKAGLPTGDLQDHLVSISDALSTALSNLEG